MTFTQRLDHKKLCIQCGLQTFKMNASWGWIYWSFTNVALVDNVFHISGEVRVGVDLHKPNAVIQHMHLTGQRQVKKGTEIANWESESVQLSQKKVLMQN